MENIPTAAPDMTQPFAVKRRSGWRRVLRWGAWTLVGLYFIAGLSFLALREFVLPRIDHYRPQITELLKSRTGLSMTLDTLSADWYGLRPRLHLSGVTLRDEQGRAVLQVPRVDAMLAWSSILRQQVYFYRLEVLSPELDVRRGADGRLFVAGLEIGTAADDGVFQAAQGDGGGSRFAAWVLDQRDVVIRDAVLVWSDALRGTPVLRLDQVGLRLAAAGFGKPADWRYFGFQARPPESMATLLDVRGELHGVPGASPDWQLSVFAALDSRDFSAWQPWIAYPSNLSGRGSVRIWAELGGEGFESLNMRLALNDAAMRLSEGETEFRLKHVQGRFDMRRAPEGLELSAGELEISAGEGIEIAPFNAKLLLPYQNGTVEMRDGKAFVSSLDLAVLSRLASRMPLDEALKARLEAFAPQGLLTDIDLSWQGHWREPSDWTLNATFSELGIKAYQKIPGFSGMAGEINGQRGEGRYRIDSDTMAVDLPTIFPEPRITLSRFQADGRWQLKDKTLEVMLDAAAFENQDAAGEASGTYATSFKGLGDIDLSARLTRGQAQAVWRYLPKVVNEHARDWLKQALKEGSTDDARLRLWGPLQQFPFREAGTGQFLITVAVADGTLHYADDWPDIDHIDGMLRFEGESMRFDAQQGQTLGAKLSEVVVEIPELNAPDGDMLLIQGKATGATGAFIRFVNESPVSQQTAGATADMQAEGNGTLDLSLKMPLRHMDKTAIAGKFRFANNQLAVFDALPPVSKASGLVRFTEQGITIPEIKGLFLGKPSRITASTRGKTVTLKATGSMDMAAARQVYPFPALSRLSGSAEWRSDIQVDTGRVKVMIDSDLQGISAVLPTPLAKAAQDSWPLHTELLFEQGGTRLKIGAVLDKRINVQLERSKKEGVWTIENGGVGIGIPAEASARGVLLSARLDELDVDAWRQALESSPAKGQVALAAEASDWAGYVSGIDLQAGKVKASGQILTQVELGAFSDSGGWKGRLSSQQAEGTFDWRSGSSQLLSAQFKRLALGGEESEDMPEVLEQTVSPETLPALNVTAEQFILKGMEMGSLSLDARNRDGVWFLDTFELRNADGVLNGSGQWRSSGSSRTAMKIRLETGDIGALLARVKHPDVIQGGHASLSGDINWPGAPTQMKLTALSGELALEADGGQFRKLKPGFGRLLGVLSLQALPRRFSLDFRDVFSEGYAFDRISGSVALNTGKLRTDNLQIEGPAAKILITGSADTTNETQSLKVLVQPTLSESIALGAAASLINPVVGVVTYIAQKALSDPVEKIFAFGYTITGNWSDPHVEKLLDRATTPDGQQAGREK